MAGYATGSANRLTNDGVFTYSYDAEANLTKRSKGASAETWSYGYDHRNQLIWVEKRATDGGTLLLREDYTYDAENRRVKEVTTTGGGTTERRFVYDGDQVAIEMTSTNTPVLWYLRGSGEGELHARLQASGTASWLAQDRLGSVRDVLSQSGAVVNHLDYDAFGNIQIQHDAALTGDYGFTGLWWSADTGLYHAIWRVYGPSWGGWMQEDPIRFEAGDLNIRRYVGNDPVNSTDLSGLWAVSRPYKKGTPNALHAEATAANGDTVETLARQEGLDPKEYVKWLQFPKGVNKIALADGKEVGLHELKSDSKIKRGEKVLVPNTILFLWMGDLTFFGGPAAVGWTQDQEWLRQQGYNVQATQDIAMVGGKPKQVLDAEKILGLMSNMARNKSLAGLIVTGHGNESGIGNRGGPIGAIRPGAEVSITYAQMKKNIGYGLSWVILNVCLGGFQKGDTIGKPSGVDMPIKLMTEGGKDLSSNMPGSRFGGLTRVLVPVADTFHPKTLKAQPWKAD